MRRELCCFALLAWCASASAAPTKDVPAKHWAAPAVQSVRQKGIMTPDADGQFHGNRPVTRYELAVVLDRFVRYMEAARKPLTPGAPVPVPASKAVPPPVPARALSHLVGNGFLPPTTPLLVKDGTQFATAQEVADATAQVVAHISDRALPPTPR